MIICAAIKVEHTDAFGHKLDDLIVCGHRHCNCFQIIKYLDLNTTSRTQGFINHKGEFLDRKEAYKHALDCGQINVHDKRYREDSKIPDELYSEDLY